MKKKEEKEKEKVSYVLKEKVRELQESGKNFGVIKVKIKRSKFRRFKKLKIPKKSNKEGGEF